MRVGSAIVVSVVLLWAVGPATARPLAAGSCAALMSTSLQFKGVMMSQSKVSTREGCCEACTKTPGCQMWWFKDPGGAVAEFSCEMYSLDKGPITWAIQYQSQSGLMSSGPSALVEHSSDCDSGVWLFKGIAIDGVVKGLAGADPYRLEGEFRNGFSTNSWQECCKGALAAPGTTLMERSYQYRGRQYWTWNPSDKRCTVKVRPFQSGAQVLTLRKAPGIISGMFGNEP